MGDVTLADAEAHLSELVDRAMQGEKIRITRHGEPVAVIAGVDREPKPIDLAALRALTDAMPFQPEPAGIWLRSWRDGARY